MNEPLFQKDSYARSCKSEIVSLAAGGVVLRQSVFFPRAGGQQGDQGELECTTEQLSKKLRVQDCIYQTEQDSVTQVSVTQVSVTQDSGTQDSGTQDSGTQDSGTKDSDAKVIVHLIDEHDQQSGKLAIGDVVEAHIDWHRRYAMMRLHTALHLLCSLVPHGVTGGNIAPNKARLDFDCGGADLCRASLQEKLSSLVADDRAVVSRWVDEEVLTKDPSLVRTLSVQPPRGTGRVRLIDIADCDLQPCGGTHVKSTAEIGEIIVGKIENKGRHNRRISLRLADTLTEINN